MGGAQELRARLWRRRSPAEQILLCCTRQDFDEVWQQRALEIAVRRPVRWDDTLSIAVLHQVTPLIYRNLQACRELAERVPGDVLSRFRQAVVLNVQKKARMATALSEALGYFSDNGIEVLLVKGTALDVRVYEETWLTASQDINLVLETDWDRLAEPVRERIRRMNRSQPLIDVHCERHPDLVMNGLLPLDFGRMLASAERHELHGPIRIVEFEIRCARQIAAPHVPIKILYRGDSFGNGHRAVPAAQ